MFGICLSPISNACDIPSDEALVCEVVLCNPLGLAISESRSKCIQINRRFAVYLATLGFWSNPPTCKMRDKSCNQTGEKIVEKDVSFCEFGSPSEREACLRALRPPRDDCNDDWPREDPRFRDCRGDDEHERE